MPNEPPGRVLSTTRESLRMVELIKRLDGAQVFELVEALEMSKSSVYNHLTTLRDQGYVVKEGNVYHVGLKYFHMGEYARTQRVAYKPIYLAMAEIMKETNLEVDFSVQEGRRVIVIFEHTNTQNWDSFQLGQYLFLHTNAAGKAILAEHPNEYVTDLIKDVGLPRRTPNTITTREELFDELRQIRDRGYATNDEENTQGIQAVATTVTEPNGDVIGGLSISGPTYRFPDHQDVADVLLNRTQQLEDDITEEWRKRLHS